MSPEHLMPLGWQARHMRATVCAGPTQFAAQAPFMLAISRATDSLSEAEAIADEMDEMFARSPRRQWGAVAQAAMSLSAREAMK